MDTRELIDKLGDELAPVKPLAPAGRRALGLCLVCIIFVMAVIYALHGPRPDLMRALRSPFYLAQTVSMFLAGLLASIATFRLCVPDTKVRAPERVMLGAASAIWLFILSDTFGQVMKIGLAPPDHGDACVIGFSAMMTLPLAVVIRMMTKGAPVWRGWAGYAALLSIASFSATGMRVFCPNDAPEHLLVWHFLPVAVAALAGIALGRFLLKTRLAKI